MSEDVLISIYKNLCTFSEIPVIMQENFLLEAVGVLEKYFIAALNAANLIGCKRLQLLMKFFGSAEAVWNASDKDLSETGLPDKALHSLLDFRHKHPNAPEKLVKFCRKKKFKLCSFTDDDYPSILKEISSPPPVFYYIGRIETHVDRIAIVGTRRPTSYGTKIAQNLGEDLAAAGMTVVSGAARGIDTFAHIGALKGGRTVAVLGCGINCMDSQGNRRLLADIAEHGLVMSEFEPNLRPSPLTFPPRNRIIAGLCKGVIVVQAGAKSGALITSSYAGEYSRDVFAVPGDISLQMSEGCHKLIRDGATLITSARDILEQYKIASEKVAARNIHVETVSTGTPIIEVETVKLNDNEQKIFDMIPPADYITEDEILMRNDDILPNEISEIMLSLELKNCIAADDFGRYTRVN